MMNHECVFCGKFTLYSRVLATLLDYCLRFLGQFVCRLLLLRCGIECQVSESKGGVHTHIVG